MFRGCRTSTLCALLVMTLMTFGTARSAPTTAPAGEDTPVARAFTTSRICSGRKAIIRRKMKMRSLAAVVACRSVPGGPPPAGPTPQNDPSVFIKLIESTVASDSWKDNGGSIGSIQELSGKLVITQTPDNHHAIEKVLEAMRG